MPSAVALPLYDVISFSTYDAKSSVFASLVFEKPIYAVPSKPPSL